MLVSPKVPDRQRMSFAYLVHACRVGEIGRSIVLGGNEHAVALSCGEINHICSGLLGVDAINFDYLHRMAFKPDILSGKGSDVDDAEQISLPGFDYRCEVLRVVEQGRFWDRLCSGRVQYADEAFEEAGHEVMVPV